MHVYGNAAPHIRALCGERRVALHEFAWHPAVERTALQRDALYLVRPDGYVGPAATKQSAAALATYLDGHT